MCHPKIMMNTKSDLIMLIDWENISYGRKQFVDLDGIIEKAKNWGDLRHSIAYSGFNIKYASLIGLMHQKGIEPRYTLTKQIKDGEEYTIKNAADIHLSVEAMTIAHTNPAISGFVIVSGDGGFLPLIRTLKVLGKRVYVIGKDRKSTMKAMAQEVDGLAYHSELGEEE